MIDLIALWCRDAKYEEEGMTIDDLGLGFEEGPHLEYSDAGALHELPRVEAGPAWWLLNLDVPMGQTLRTHRDTVGRKNVTER